MCVMQATVSWQTRLPKFKEVDSHQEYNADLESAKEITVIDNNTHTLFERRQSNTLSLMSQIQL